MPAYIVDELDNSGNPMNVNASLSDMEIPNEPAPAEVETPVPDSTDVPVKYRDKSAAELLAILQEQESHIGKQGSELGELRGQVGTLRGLVDKSLDMRNEGYSREDVGVEEDLTDTDFITDPRDAVTRTVQRQTREQNERLAKLERDATAQDFARRYPTAQTDVESEDFVKFVQSGATRSKIAARAFSDIENIDFDAAEELWELWEDYKSMRPAEPVTETAEMEHPSPAEEAPQRKAPAMIKTGSSGDVGASTKPMYSQQALNRMQAKDPDLFWATDTQAKIQQAYAEGRVVQD